MIVSNSVCREGNKFARNPNQNISEASTFYIVTVIASTVGIVICLIAFCLLVLTAILFSEWRNNRKNQYLIQFTLARILYTLMRYILEVRKSIYSSNIECVIYLDVLALTFTECLLIAWMFIFSKHLNDSLVKVFNVEKYAMWKVSTLTWLIPGVVAFLVNISFSIQTDKEMTFFMLYLFLIKWPVLCANAILLITALKAVIKTNQSNVESNFRITVVMILLIFGFSVQQIIIDVYKVIRLFSQDYFVSYYMNIINVFTIYHCAASILFWLFGNANTRKLWKFEGSKPPASNEISARMSV